MIRYTLKCADGHSFDSWFKSAEAFEALEGRGLLSCSVCGSSDVQKAMMAPRVAKSASKPEENAPVSLSKPANPMEEALSALRKHVEENSTYVGGNFAREARKIHLGEAPDRLIHGEANPEEAKALIEDGIPVAPLPIIPKNRST
ncbi:DUF1178 family protein [Nioella aestuarii]|uniref:DUF1178 family protein n=1 Tax=Nioella aestuarii TaxID=1662864 RepID=UPI003D7F77F2